MNKIILFILFIFYIGFSQAPQSVKGWMLADTTIDTSKINNEFKSLIYGGAINALYYGFDPANSATDNYNALQMALNGGNKIIEVTKPGTYQFNHFFRIYSNTELRFGEGVILSKVSGDSSWNSFINYGAWKHTVDSNIVITGLHIKTNGLALSAPLGDSLYAVRGELAFFNAKNITIRDYRVLDLGTVHWGVFFGTGKNFIIENFEIRGDKDGIMIQDWEGGIIRDGVISTLDDRISLRGGDYPGVTPRQGITKDILIESVSEEIYSSAYSGFFFRDISSAWVSWYSGMQVAKGYTVENGGNVYRVIAPTTLTASTVAPTGRSRYFTTGDGISWKFDSDDGIKEAYTTNIIFRNCVVRNHNIAFNSYSYDNPGVHTPVSPDTLAPKAKDNWMTVENLVDEWDGDYPLFRVKTSKTVNIINPETTRKLLEIKTTKESLDEEVVVNIRDWIVDEPLSAATVTDRSDIFITDTFSVVRLNVNTAYQTRDIEILNVKNSSLRERTITGKASISELKDFNGVNGNEITVRNDPRAFYNKWVSKGISNKAILATFDTDVSTTFTATVKGTSGKSIRIDYGDDTVTDYAMTGSSVSINHTYKSGAGAKRFLVTGDVDDLTEINISSTGNQFYFDIGQLADLNSMTNIYIGTNYNITGDVATLKNKTNLVQFQADNDNLYGDIASFKNLTSLDRLYLPNTRISGYIDSLKTLTSMVNIILNDNDYLRGDLSVIKNFSTSLNICRIYNTKCNQYTASTLKDWKGAKIQIQNNGLSSSEVDQFLNDLAAVSTAGASSTLTITVTGGTNGKRTSASDAAITTLTTNGWTITAD